MTDLTKPLTDIFAKSTRREMIGRATRMAASLAVGSALAPLLAAPGGRGFQNRSARMVFAQSRSFLL